MTLVTEGSNDHLFEAVRRALNDRTQRRGSASDIDVRYAERIRELRRALQGLIAEVTALRRQAAEAEATNARLAAELDMLNTR